MASKCQARLIKSISQIEIKISRQTPNYEKIISEVESIAGAPSVLASPFAAMHGLPSPLAGPYNGVPPAGGLAGLSGFNALGAAGALGVRVPGSPQPSCVLLISNLNEEVGFYLSTTPQLNRLPPFFLSSSFL